MTSRPLVLASGSRYRRELLARLGLPFESVSPPFDEDAAKEALRASGATVEQLVATLARGKASSLAATHPDAWIIGSDQMAECDGLLLGKPGDEAGARAQLAQLAGRTHRLVTAVCVLDARTGRIEEAMDVHTVVMRALSSREIADYVARDRPLDCAGSYRVEALGIALFERITGDDSTAVIGLPLTQVVSLLSRMGVPVLGRDSAV